MSGVLSSGRILMAGLILLGFSVTLLLEILLAYREHRDNQHHARMRLIGHKRYGAGIVPSALREWFADRVSPWGTRMRRKHDRAACERDFPAMLEVIALGMRAGMSFDNAFELYTQRFDNHLASLCGESLGVWKNGLVTREQGMRDLAKRIDTPFFSRFTEATLRAIRFGAPMTHMLADLAYEARKEYRAMREERVAKAPVKMLIPTGALILPAMLLLVLGPVVLDLFETMM